MSSAREAAKKLIRVYVERDSSEDSFNYLREGHMGSSSPNGPSVSIGGYMPVGVKNWGPDWILVYRDMEGIEVNQAFKLREIFEECKQGQQVLL